MANILMLFFKINVKITKMLRVKDKDREAVLTTGNSRGSWDLTWKERRADFSASTNEAGKEKQEAFLGRAEANKARLQTQRESEDFSSPKPRATAPK